MFNVISSFQVSGVNKKPVQHTSDWRQCQLIIGQGKPIRPIELLDNICQPGAAAIPGS